ncbi:MAG: type II toxin-antitoxin system RelE/ParE family toxin [Bradyrhizobium sp.]|nr:type II toxin-antitoxin system RelE/ParE family toxin [Bradyrhizobium sp.]
MALGLVDADVSGHVYKKRVPAAGRGKRGGARTIIGSNLGDRWFFVRIREERASYD